MKDAELIRVCQEFRNGLIGENASPEGECAKVSMALAGYLRAICEIDVECVKSDLSQNPNSNWYNHVWLKMPDGRVLDATFDQFSSEDTVKVYLGKPTEFHLEPEPAEGC